MVTSVSDLLAARRPHRTDAARNFDAILAAARDLFATLGTQVTLADVAKRAGVGAATLYRHFPTREDLAEAVYVSEVDELCRYGDEFAATREPGEALAEWIRRFVTYMATKRDLLAALDRSSGAFLACKYALFASGGRLLTAAQEAGAARDDVDIDDVMRFVIGVTNSPFGSDAQRDRILRLAVDAVRRP
ncbi:TetR family transcriptional regulator [Streptomyces sulfonofaciens]|uniref:TetR family transcriptional regulator n=1 Tax=Streptomyces sulfonofaciens TaxID=68272 RepID=A0A919KZH0_9ACTN|nr:TetR/AcrR family transcriptional regulator [Streptomyces sulfonofaciens]GHH77814.1 TetR family transcriptional regulator [Streptomyces sulfonofaciens]